MFLYLCAIRNHVIRLFQIHEHHANMKSQRSSICLWSLNGSTRRWIDRWQTVANLWSHHSLHQGLQHVLLQIFRILNSTANPDQILKYTDPISALLGNTSMRHGARHFDQTLHATQAFCEHKYSRRLAKSLSSCMAALYSEAEHSA